MLVAETVSLIWGVQRAACQKRITSTKWREFVETVHDAIRAHNYLANERVFKLRHNPTKLWGLAKKPGSRNQKQTEFKGAIRSVEGDVTDNVAKVSAGGGRKDYLIIH
jgi:hypothetical protein